jgi:predicted dehydrogenase
MGKKKVVAGFIGAGGIARSHAFSLNSLKYYYDDAPDIELAAVCSATRESRELFARRFGFIRACDLKDFVSDVSIDTVFILGPNKVHYEHFKTVLGMKAIKRVYIEKPVCSTPVEEASMRKLVESNPSVKFQVGFQYLFTSAVRDALLLWNSGKLGKPVHFDLKYYHSDYLKKEYRDKRVSRLTPAPDGGAMADLGSHSISFLIAFLGKRIRITGALQAGQFDDVPVDSDLFSQISLYDEESHAAGTLSSSRISSGTGDNLSFEFFAEKGALRYSSLSPDYFEYYTEEPGLWTRQTTAGNYRPYTTFPSAHVPPGWHRPMIHAHYIFLTGSSSEPVIPDIEHGLEVQRLVRETAEHLGKFRESRSYYKITPGG